MAGGPSVAIMRDIQTLFDSGTASGLSDRQLLERFASGSHASAEAAFEMLVLRHGPMVLRVCRNVLGDSTDAQDAFQATFLVLVRRVGSIRRLESVGSWLYGVACRVAARARVEAARRRAAERQGALQVVKSDDSREDDQSANAEFGPVVQEEVRRLPEKYRAVVALCYWEGLTHEQAAIQLGCPLGTVRSRMARARDMLRQRLTRRGLAPLAEAITPAIPIGPFPLVPSILTSATVKTGTQLLTGQAITKIASTSVTLLTQSVLRSLFIMKIKTIAVSLVLIGVGVFGASLAAPQGDSHKPGQAPGRRSPPSPDTAKIQPARVSLGDYVVEPPDLLLVEVLEALPGRPISGERLVRPDGKISLGFYGDIYVAGLTLPEVKEKVIRHLQKFLTDDGLGLIQNDAAGQPMIDPKTKQPVMIDPKDSSAVFVDVTAYNSKFYYVQGAVVVPGRFQITGNETILDAINLAGGLSPEANVDNVLLYRPENANRPLKALPVDINQITVGGDPTTNYQLKPGDRLVVPQLPRKGTAYERPESSDVRTATAVPDRNVPALHFDRRPDDHNADSLQPYRPRADRSAGNASTRERATLQDVQKRLKDVEQKLDAILAILQSQNR